MDDAKNLDTKTITKNQITGWYGEYFFGSFVHKELNCIYRSQSSADIGIDGEIEISENQCNDKYKSTGKILKVQIKTTKENSIKRKDIFYLSTLSVPAILIKIDDTKVYWADPRLGKAHDSYALNNYNITLTEITSDSKNATISAWESIIDEKKRTQDELSSKLDQLIAQALFLCEELQELQKFQYKNTPNDDNPTNFEINHKPIRKHTIEYIKTMYHEIYKEQIENISQLMYEKNIMNNHAKIKKKSC